jgi:dihydroflavonol-4-reductase
MIFVTGGTGLIGAHLLYELVLTHKKVRALKRETSDVQQVVKIFSYYTENPEELFSRIEWVNGDILDYFGLEQLTKGVDEIYHCAAIISFRRGDRRLMIRNNIEGTGNLVNAALQNNVKKICHVSSVSALGPNQNGYPTDEETNWIPSKRVTSYSQSKFFSETEIWRGIEEGLNAVIVSPSIVLGPGNWKSGSPQLFQTVWDGMKFYTRGITGYVDVKDVVKAMILLMEKENFEKYKNQRFLLNSENWSYQEIFNHIADELNRPRPTWFASKLMLGLGWRAVSAFNQFMKKLPAITRETAVAATAINRFDGSKITKIPGFEYLPVTDSINRTAKYFLTDIPSRNE